MDEGITVGELKDLLYEMDDMDSVVLYLDGAKYVLTGACKNGFNLKITAKQISRDTKSESDDKKEFEF